MTTARVTTVIVTYNSMKTIGDALASLARCRAAGLVHAVVVVDNESRDGTPEFVAREFPDVTLVRARANLGFGRGNNRGFEEVTTEFTLFLNPDASIEPPAVRTLLAFMDQTPRAAVCVPAAETASGGYHIWQSSLRPSHVIAAAFGRGKPARSLVPGEKPFQVEWAPGAALFFRSDSFRKLGGFDPRFFLYFEETDLLLRVRKIGMEVWAVCEAVIFHTGQGSAKQEGVPMFSHCIAEHFFQSRLYYLAKHYGRTQALLVEGAELAIMSLRVLPELVRKRDVLLLARLSGPMFQMPPERAAPPR